MKLIIKQEKKNDSTTSNCPKCSAVVTAGYAFCENCGFRLSTTSLVTTVNKCPKCNMAVSDEHIFCTGCGFNLKNMIENIESNDKKVCDKCKTVADEADIFCTSCGNRL